MVIFFQKAEFSDIDFLLELRLKTMEKYLQNEGVFLSKTQHRQRVLEDFENAFLIMKNEQKIGLLKYKLTDTNWKIVQFQILPEFQKKGIGWQVLEYCVNESQKEGKTLILNVLKQNPAVQLYQKFGFQITGQDEIEYFMKWEKSAN